MLCLSRKVGERIIIDGRIAIEILAVTSGSRVRIGISAPLDIPIEREELLDRDRDTVSDPDQLGLQTCS